jgi:hypothetical protein
MATFREHYLSIPNKKAITPKQKFIDEICALTKKCEKTVRCWIAETQKPDALARSIIAQKLNMPVGELFPKENYTYVRKQTPASE